MNLTFNENSLLTVSPSELSALQEYLPAEKRVTFCSTRLWFDLMIFVLLFDFNGRPYGGEMVGRKHTKNMFFDFFFIFFACFSSLYLHYATMSSVSTEDSHRFYTRNRHHRLLLCRWVVASSPIVGLLRVDLMNK